MALPLAILGLAITLGAFSLLGAGVIPVVIYLHVAFVLFMTAWHLRKDHDFNYGKTAQKAAILSIPLALVLWILPLGLAALGSGLQRGHVMQDPTAGDLRILGGILVYSQQASGFLFFDRQITWFVWTGVWAIVCGAGLPGRLMQGRATGAPIASTAAMIVVALVPWLALFSLLGLPAETCTGECWGVFEGGAVMFPLLGLYLFTLATSCAAVSAAQLWSTKPVPPILYS